jgi:hypothetical protein
VRMVRRSVRPCPRSSQTWVVWGPFGVGSGKDPLSGGVREGLVALQDQDVVSVELPRLR